MSIFTQLNAILWKNLHIRFRHWILLMFEILIPVILFVLVAYGRSKITGLNKEEVAGVTINEKYPISFDYSGINIERTLFYYTPTNDFYDDLLHRVQEKFQIINNNVFGFSSPELLLDSYVKNSNSTVMSIIFKPNNYSNLDYTLRYHKEWYSSETAKLYIKDSEILPGTGSNYLWEGLVTLQAALDLSFIEKHMENQGKTMPSVFLETLEFPYPPHKVDSGLSALFLHYYPLITLFSFIFVCPAVINRVVAEKHTGIKELMKMVGTKTSIIWLGWFIYSIIPLIFSSIIITVILKVDFFEAGYPPIEFSSGTLLITFLTLYCIASVSACFFLSTLFQKPTLATLVGLLVWILSYFIPKYMTENSNCNQGRLSCWISKLVSMFLPNMGLHYGFAAMAYYEEREIGVQWNNWHVPGDGDDTGVTMLQVCLMFIFSSVMYLMLTLCVDAVNPGKYGIPKPILLYFKWPFQGRFKSSNKKKTIFHEIQLRSPEEEGLCHQEENAIELLNVTKTYGKRTVIDISKMAIKKNRISVLLGPNGAGKSTTMGVMTGMIRKSAGTIRINGKKISSPSDLSNSIGLCSQHNLYFSDLTVEEHLWFFAKLKGRDKNETKQEISFLLDKLKLKDKKNQQVHTLSGGMKRKLCLGMAIIGGSNILILDEPSAGLDIQYRMDMWNFLLELKKDRTILITTHSMEEADALADYVFVLKEGKLIKEADPSVLKQQYGAGYELRIILKENADIKAEKVHEEIRKSVDLATLENTNGPLIFRSPELDLNMLEKLEAMKEELQIDDLVINYVTLENIFASLYKDEHFNHKGKRKIPEIEMNNDLLKGNPRLWLRFKALFYKRWRVMYLKLKTYLIPAIIALMLIMTSVYIGRAGRFLHGSKEPLFEMSLDSYGPSTVYYEPLNSPASKLMSNYYNQCITDAKLEHTSISVENITGGLIEEAVTNLPRFRHHIIVGAEISILEGQIEATGLYNNIAKHSAPISINLLTNSLAKYLLGEHYSIRYVLHPLENLGTIVNSDEISVTEIGLLWLIVIPMAFLFFSGIFIYFPHGELSTNFTLLQEMCGAGPLTYWSVNFIFDYMVHTIFSVLLALLISVSWTPFMGINEFGALLYISAMYGLSCIPFCYMFSRCRSFTEGYARFVISGVLIGVLTTIAVMALQESGEEIYVNYANWIKITCLILFPQFGLTYHGVTFSKKVIENYNFDHLEGLKLMSVCSRDWVNPCCKKESLECADHRAYLPLLTKVNFMAVGAFIYLVYNITYTYSYYIRKFFKRRESCPPTSENFKEPNCGNVTLKVDNLVKKYGGKKVVNVKHFDLKKGECVGMLGVNGAGKTTTLKILTREEIKDAGNVELNNKSINSLQYMKQLSYCPQTDSLNFSLTGRDILKCIALLRGITDTGVVTELLRYLEMEDIADLPCSLYSGGSKRKLTVALAIIGLPPFILLDEPTTGVDPTSRVKLWNIIKDIKSSKQSSFILTSHSSTECEQLCDNLNIMKEGEIEKKGTITDLQATAHGYNVKFKLRSNNKSDDLKKHLKVTFIDLKFKNTQTDQIHVYIKKNDFSIVNIFSQVQNLQKKYIDLIESCVITSATLEDAFLEFVS